MWESLTARLLTLITLGIGSLLIVMAPLVSKESKVFGIISFCVGVFILLVLLYFLFSNAVIREQILRYGFN